MLTSTIILLTQTVKLSIAFMLKCITLDDIIQTCVSHYFFFRYYFATITQYVNILYVSLPYIRHTSEWYRQTPCRDH